MTRDEEWIKDILDRTVIAMRDNGSPVAARLLAAIGEARVKWTLAEFDLGTDHGELIVAVVEEAADQIVSLADMLVDFPPDIRAVTFKKIAAMLEVFCDEKFTRALAAYTATKQ